MSEEEEDFNAFNSWDCFGASALLGIIPAVMNFVFNDKDLVSTALLAAIGIAVSVAVLLVSLLTRWRMIGLLVNLAGCILTPIYCIITIYLFCTME